MNYYNPSVTSHLETFGILDAKLVISKVEVVSPTKAYVVTMLFVVLYCRESEYVTPNKNPSPKSVFLFVTYVFAEINLPKLNSVHNFSKFVN